MSKNSYDCVIIGGGIGGLTAGAILTNAGKKVVVLEKHSVVGGYASYFQRKGFTFDVSLHQIGGVQKTAMRKILEKAGVYDKVEFIKLKELYLSHYTNSPLKIALPNGDIKKLRAELLKHFPEEKKGIDTWLWWLRKVGRQLVRWDYRDTKVVKRVLVEFTAPLLVPFVVFSSRFLYAHALRHLRNPQAYKVINQLVGYYGLPATQINMQFVCAANYGYYFDGGYYVKGGGFALSEALKEEIKAGGGEVLVNAEVTRLYTQKNRLLGVGTREKKNFFGKQFISSANPFSLYSLLPHDQKVQQKLKELKQCDKSMSGTVLYLGLSKPIEEINPELGREYEIFINSQGVSEEEEMHRCLNRSDFSDDYANETTVITMHSNIDQTNIPEGKGVLNVFIMDNYARWEKLSRSEYKAQKEKETQKILNNVLAAYFPALEKHIEVKELATPLTMKKFTGNPDGALYGFSQQCSQGGPKRGKLLKTHLKNLHFTSAWGFPGGGYEGSMRGAEVVCRRLLEGWKYWLTWTALITLIATLQLRHFF